MKKRPVSCRDTGSGIEKTEEENEGIEILPDDLFHFVHSLKSAARSIGARDLAELSAFMERHRDEPSLNRLMIPVLGREYRTVSEGEELLLKELSKGSEAEHEE